MKTILAILLMFALVACTQSGRSEQLKEIACQNADKSTVTIFPGSYHDVWLRRIKGLLTIHGRNNQTNQELVHFLAPSETCYTIPQSE